MPTLRSRMAKGVTLFCDHIFDNVPSNHSSISSSMCRMPLRMSHRIPDRLRSSGSHSSLVGFFFFDFEDEEDPFLSPLPLPFSSSSSPGKKSAAKGSSGSHRETTSRVKELV